MKSLEIAPVILILAFLLDLAIGDPRWLPHPVRFIGAAIAGLEVVLRKVFRRPAGERAAGVLLVLLIIIPAFAVTAAIVLAATLHRSDPAALAGSAVLVYLTSTTIATRDLVDSARLVIDAVLNRDIVSARQRLSMIVGRDTQHLSEEAVLRATVETVAENISDGVIAPLFYLAVGGLPLAMTYKAVNTLDSMVGYKNDRYLHIGRASARLDDVANFIPARITGLLVVFAVFLLTLAGKAKRPLMDARRALTVMLRDGRKHSSPNSGIPEAAVAGGLGVVLGGPSTYGGIIVEKPYIGEGLGREYLPASLEALSIARMTALIGAGLAACVLQVRTIL